MTPPTPEPTTLAPPSVEDLAPVLDRIQGAVSELSAPQALGGEASVIAALGLLAGITLWLCGGKVLKPAFAILGVTVGAFLGVVLFPLTGLGTIDTGWATMPQITPAQIGMVAGGTLGLIFSVALFRTAMALGAGLAFAAAGTLGAMVYLQAAPQTAAQPAQDEGVDSAFIERDVEIDPLIETPALDEASSFLERVESEPLPSERTRLGLSGDELVAAKAAFTETAERSRVFIDQSLDALSSWWEAKPVRERVTLLGGALIGGVIGLLFGLMMPNRSAAIITSLAGAAITLLFFVTLAEANAWPGRQLATMSPGAVAGVWGGMSVVGIVAQLMIKRRQTKRVVVRSSDSE